MYTFGKAKSLDSITGKDVIDNKLWIWVWEANLEETYPEDYQVPVFGINNLEDIFVEPIITLYVKGYDSIIASASYDFSRDCLYAISVWYNDEWLLLNNCSFLKEPIELITSIMIKNQENRRFICQSKSEDIAYPK